MQICAQKNILELVDGLVREALASRDGRRAEVRIPFHTPVAFYSLDGELLSDQAVTRDLSPHGIGLLHRAELPTRRVLAEFYISQGENLVGEIEVRWTKPYGQGWFASGARFVIDS